jgi:hypothetical protein
LTGERDPLAALWRLAVSEELDARMRDHVRATVLFVLVAQLLAGGAGAAQRPEAGAGFGVAESWEAPRRARPPWRGSLTGRRPRG